MSTFKPDGPHSARPTPVNDPANPFKLVEPVCCVCGQPIERRRRNAAPGAWKHTTTPTRSTT